MPSPVCTVKDGAGSPQTTPPFATITPGNTVTIAVASTTGVKTWSIECYGADETTDPTSIALTVDTAAKTATFTAPAASKALLFRSTINGAVDVNSADRADWITTFKVATLTPNNYAVGAVGEEYQHDATYGHLEILNTVVRDAGTFLSGTITATTVDWTPAGVSTYRVKSTLATVQTTDATVTTLATFALPDARITDLIATITGHEPATGDCYRVDVGVTYHRFSAGAPVLVGALLAANERTTASAATWDGTIDVSSNSARVRVTGQVAKTINWSCELRTQERS